MSLRSVSPQGAINRRKRGLLLLLLAAGVGVFLLLRVRSEPRGRHYPQTGFSVDPAFLVFYDEHGGPRIFGYPISEATLDAERGVVVQYFERGVLEIGPRQDGVLEVRPGALGRILGKAEPGIEDGEAISGCAFYAQTGHYVCHQFLEFYLRNGGPELFGYPIAEYRIEQGRMVQYFENFRLDWLPGEEEQIQIAPLGMAYLELSQAAAGPVASVVASREEREEAPAGLRVQTSVHPPFGGASGEQQVFVVVSDEQGRPIQGAAVFMIARFGDQPRAFLLPKTDQEGRSGLRLAYADQQPNTSVQLDFWVVYRGLQAQTRDSFLIWW